MTWCRYSTQIASASCHCVLNLFRIVGKAKFGLGLGVTLFNAPDSQCLRMLLGALNPPRPKSTAAQLHDQVRRSDQRVHQPLLPLPAHRREARITVPVYYAPNSSSNRAAHRHHIPHINQPGIPSNCGKSSGATHCSRRLTNISSLGAIWPELSRLPSVTKTAPGKLSRLLENTRAPQSGQ